MALPTAQRKSIALTIIYRRAAIEFKSAGTVVGTEIAKTSGIATLPYSAALSTVKGNYVITVTFYGDAAHSSTTRNATLRVK